jgi:hypothetical protein
MIGLDRKPERMPVDLVILLDVSAATDEPSGLDVDADRERGFHPGRYLRILQPSDYSLHCTDPDDTILAAEIAAANRLIEHVGGDAYARLTLMVFSTDAPKNDLPEPPRWRAPEPADKLKRRLDMLRKGAWFNPPSEHTALEAAVAALRPPGGSDRRVIVILTATPEPSPGATDPPHQRSDGVVPWSQVGPEASTLKASGIELHVLGFGPMGNMPPGELDRFTRSAGGAYQAAEVLSDVASVFRGDLARFVDRVEIANSDFGDRSTDVVFSGDGAFSGHIRLREGSNHIKVWLETSLDVIGEDVVEVEFRRTDPTPWSLLVDLETIEDRNRELFRLIEREKALRRARDLGKGLEVEVEK